MITQPDFPSLPALPHLLKVTEVAKLLRLSRQSVKALIDAGDLAAAPLGPTRRKLKRVHMRVTRESLTRLYQKRFNRDINSVLQPTNR